jgi:SAM-dependent methyltransferase
MSTFDLYSEYYNLLYQDKNYAAEAKFVASTIRKYSPRAKSLLNLGCGTGKHDFLLAGKGFDVVGVDMSRQMLAQAEIEKRCSRISNVTFVKSDIREFSSAKKFDAIISLFHVMSYLNEDEDVLAALKTVTRHLKSGGIFVFDFWYGPAVLTDKPTVRMKRMENELLRVSRVAEPEMDYSKNLVTVNYDVFIQDKSSQSIEEVREAHHMRYFFEPEMRSFLEDSELRILEAKEWMTGKRLSCSSWNAVFVCQKVASRGKR